MVCNHLHAGSRHPRPARSRVTVEGRRCQAQEQNRIFGQTPRQPCSHSRERRTDPPHDHPPLDGGLAVSLFGIFTIGYLAATAYLVLRDDLIGATMARQARMQHEYEDRIAALRAQVDRITSRQLLDQQVVEDKVEKLLEQQTGAGQPPRQDRLRARTR